VLVAGQRHQREVERLVRRRLLAPVAARRPLHALDGAARDRQPARVGGAAAIEHAPQREALEHVAQAEQLLDVPRRQRHDPHPRQGRCSTRPCCPSSRSASRSGARLTQPARELLLDQPLAGCEGTADDLPTQPADGQLDQALRLQDTRLQLRRHGATSLTLGSAAPGRAASDGDFASSVTTPPIAGACPA
jgi:hypothetical protein